MGVPAGIGLGAAVALIGLMTSGCGSDSESAASAAPGIVLGGSAASSPPAPPIQADAAGTSSEPVIDPLADLDIDDQRGDGTQVIVESLSTSLPGGVTLVILDGKGRTIAEVPVTPGVQPVTVLLDSTLTRSQELQGMLMAPGGGGILVDNEGEAVEEDFDYVIR